MLLCACDDCDPNILSEEPSYGTAQHKLTWKYLLPPLHSPVRLQLFQQLVSDDLRDDAL